MLWIVIKNPDFARPLVEMRDLLRRARATCHAEETERVLRLLLTDQDEAMDALTGLTFWGGSGSFADLILDPGNGHVSDDFERDNRAYRRLLLELYENIKAEGHSVSGRML